MYLKRRKLSDTSRAMEAADSRPVVAPRGPDTLSPEIASRQQVDGDVPDVDVNVSPQPIKAIAVCVVC